MKNIAAAFVFFTRLPFWRIKYFQVPAEYFSNVINYWAVAGWVTASVMAAVLFLSSYILPYTVAIILAVVARVMVTGALHEDGLADFFDGFGGGNTRERTLDIMKDSHIGTYGVLSLILYFMMLVSLLNNLPVRFACFAILAGDPFCKLIASQITRFLSYARTAETSKSKTVYTPITNSSLAVSLFFGLAPFILLFKIHFWLAALLPIFVFTGLILIMKKKIGGYTGDCCGAVFLLCELSFYLGISLLFKFVTI